MDDLLQEFIAETRETLEAISGEIIGWEAAPDDRARLDAIFRFVHTIKGSCGFLDLPRLTRLSHAAEDALSAVRDGRRAPDARLVTAILAIIDRIGEVVEAIDAGAALDDSGEDMLIAALDGAPPPGLIAIVDAADVVAPDHNAPAFRAAKRTVRLSVDLLDDMMSGVSDMVLARNQLARGLREQGDPRLEAMLERLTMTVDNLRDTVTRTRMQRIEMLFAPLPRLVRDVAAVVGKQVSLTIEGGDVELDREMIELLRDPLVHLVRNAIDHGIETMEARHAAGKPSAGVLKVSARQAGNLILIEIADDGAGIDTDRLVAKIGREQPHRQRQLAQLSDHDRAALVFEPGLSSRDEATSVSGRGVGMDVVKANVEQTGGRIQLLNRPGQGLTVSLEVPLTLAILNAVMVNAAGSRFALSRQVVEEIVAVDQSQVRVDRFGSSAMVVVRGQRLPLVNLERLLGRPESERLRLLAVVSVRAGRYALALDDVTDTQELVVKPAAPAVMRVGIFAGQMLPDDGQPLLLLDVAGIAERAGLSFEAVSEKAVEATAVEPVRALLFDDVDGVRRMIPADAVDRIERVGTTHVNLAAGTLWLTSDGRSVPVYDGAGAHRAEDVTTVLRLQLDDRELAYPVRTAIEIVPLPDELTPADAGAASGVALVDGRPVELLDPLRLLEAMGAAVGGERPLCLLHGGEGPWMEVFLRPTIEAAGYRAVRQLAPGEQARVALAMADDADPPVGTVIRLGRARGEGVYRYDRAALVAALQEMRA
ncbi:chemotaxis protein CheA [Sphingomonas corticis]|jgi:two-component system chemotaxis sensor kinase CheA|uniref:histidine kinase n=1 Tax=Sphingomonas corticis TaxID=2722791 RepID=A0ABX1CT35_9SPHN|nr:chemotaxis protein CheW [Sphingomonas corticis]NJR79465.1 chemotaxis protein CheA [Sphingomonas corticis]